MSNELKDYVVFKRDGAKKISNLRLKHLRELKKEGVRYKGISQSTRTLVYTPQDGVTYHNVTKIKVHPEDLDKAAEIIRNVDYHAARAAKLGVFR